MKQYKFLKSIMLIGVVTFLFTSCASVNNVVTDYHTNANFSDFTTYNFWDDVKLDEGKPSYDQLDERRIKEATAKSLEAKGYAFSEQSPDLLVNVRLIVKTRRNATAMNPYFGYWRFGGQNININEYEEATILIDLIDAERNVLVWQGSVQSPDVKNPEDKDRKIKDAVMKMFLKYPYRAGSNNQSSSD